MIFDRLNRLRYLFLALMALSAIVYLGSSLALGPNTEVDHLDPDEQEYYSLASDLLYGEYEFNSRRTLFYPLILVLFRLVTFDNLVATQLLATAIFSLSVPLMYLLVWRITGHNLLAITVAVFVMFWPPFVYYGSSLYSETMALPFFITLLILLPRGSVFTNRSEGGWHRCVLAGSVMGLCMLIRPMYLLFSPLAAGILFLEEYKVTVALQRALLLTIGCCLVVLPWSAYISTRAGVPILVSANGGETISGGLNPVLIEKGYKVHVAPDSRQYWVGPGKWLRMSESGYLSQEEQKLPYAQKDKLLRQRTMAWVLENPRSALFLQTAKLRYMWGFYPFREGTKQTLFGNLPPVIFISLSVASLIRFRGYLRYLSRFWCLPLFVSLVALISWGSWRFRQSGDLGILMLSGLFLWSLFVRPSRLISLASHRDD